MTDHYSILGLKPDASKAQIRKAYRKLAMEWHPDLNPSPESEEKFVRINEAYETLMDERPAAVRGKTSPAADPSKATATGKRRDDLRERMRRHAQRRQEQFEKERTGYRASFLYKLWCYAEIGYNLLMILVAVAVPVGIAIYNNSWLYLCLLILSAGVGASFYFKGARLWKRTQMIYGNKETFTLQELEDIYFYRERAEVPGRGNDFPGSWM